MTDWQVLGQAPYGADESGDNFGHSLATVMIGKQANLAVSAPNEKYAGKVQGRAAVYGLSGALLQGRFKYAPPPDKVHFGFALASGDFRGVGDDDVAIADPEEGGTVLCGSITSPVFYSVWQMSLGRTSAV